MRAGLDLGNGTYACDFRVRIVDCTDADFMANLTILVFAVSLAALALGVAHVIYRYIIHKWPLVIAGRVRGIEMMLILFVGLNICNATRTGLLLFQPDASPYALELLVYFTFAFGITSLAVVAISTVDALGAVMRDTSLGNDFMAFFDSLLQRMPSTRTFDIINIGYNVTLGVAYIVLGALTAYFTTTGQGDLEQQVYMAATNLVALHYVMISLILTVTTLPFVVLIRRRFNRYGNASDFASDTKMRQTFNKTSLEIEKMFRVLALVLSVIAMQIVFLFLMADSPLAYTNIGLARTIAVIVELMPSLANFLSLCGDTIFFFQMSRIQKTPAVTSASKALSSQSEPDENSSRLEQLSAELLRSTSFGTDPSTSPAAAALADGYF